MSKLKTGAAIGLGAGLAAAAVGAALGSYLLTGKRATKTKKILRSWMLKAKGEVLEGVEKMKDVSEADYKALVDKVGAKYKAVKSIDPAEVEAMVRELHGHWKNIKKSISPAPKKKKVAKKVAK